MWRRSDAETLAKVRAALARSQSRGTDAVAALDGLGLLRSPYWQAQNKADALAEVAKALAEASLRGVTEPGQQIPRTPLDTKRVIEQWLTRYAAAMQAAADA